jgi:uncharacterized protein YecE (DUF72 family)
MTATPLFIGTSGWSYPFWGADLYAGVPHKRWLARYAALFAAVEINASFYGTLSAATLARWAGETPPHFRFAAKGPRYVTHVRRLRGVADSIGTARAALAPLGGKLSAVLWQLPPHFGLDLERLDAFLQALDAWPQVRHALEFRDPSWFIPAVAQALARHRVANCVSDAADWPRWDAVTTDLVYLRLHGHSATYLSRYATPTLLAWAQRIAHWRGEGRSVHAYFDNTDAGHAWRDAQRLQALVAQAPAAANARVQALQAVNE